MFHLIPAPVHRALLPLVFRLRHRWRLWRKVPLAGCAVIIANLDGDILLVRHSYGPDVWTLPGGGVCKGEDPIEAARREMREELALELARIELLESFEENVSDCLHTTYLFAATSDQWPRPDRREVVEARYFPRHSLPEPLGSLTRDRLERWRGWLHGD